MTLEKCTGAQIMDLLQNARQEVRVSKLYLELALTRRERDRVYIRLQLARHQVLELEAELERRRKAFDNLARVQTKGRLT